MISIELSLESRANLRRAAERRAAELRARCVRSADRRAMGIRPPLSGADLDAVRASDLATSASSLADAVSMPTLPVRAWANLLVAAERAARGARLIARDRAYVDAREEALDLEATAAKIRAALPPVPRRNAA